MAGTPGSEFSLVLLLLAVLPACGRAAPWVPERGESHSFHYDFNISNEHPWCVVQGQPGEKNCFSYDCGSHKVRSMCHLREAGKAMDSCEDAFGTLRDMGNELKALLPDIKQEKYTDGAPFTLQVRMTCQLKADGSTCGSLEFFLDGQRLLTFDSETEEYRADNSLGERLKKKWENNEYLKQFFKRIFRGDCKKLHECWVLWKIEPETTAAPITATTQATTTPTTASASPTKTTYQFNPLFIILIVIVPTLAFVCILCYHYRERLQKKLKSFWESLPAGCLSNSTSSPICLQELQSLQQVQRPPEGRADSADAMVMPFIP